MPDCRPANPRCTKSAAYPDNSWLPTASADGLPEKTVGYICLHFSSWYSFLSPKNHNWFLFCFSCDGRIGIQKKSLSPAAIRLEKETKKMISPWYHSFLVQSLHPLCHISAIMCFSVTGESRQCLLCPWAVLHCGSGRRYPAFLRLSHTNRQLSATNEPHLFSRQRLFLDTDSKPNSAVFSLFYRIFLDLSSVFLIFPHFFLSGRIFSGNRGKPYTFFVQTVKIRTECLILS